MRGTPNMTEFDVLTVAKEDLDACQMSLEDNDFRLMMIYGNRFASNLIFTDFKRYMIICYIIREMSRQLDVIKNAGNETKYYNAKEVCTDTLAKIKDSLDVEFDIVAIWKLYSDYEKLMREYVLSRNQLDSYNEHPEFTSTSTDSIVTHFLDNKELLLRRDHRLVSGTIGEIARLINTHGFKDKDLLRYMLLVIFRGIYPYIVRHHTRKKEIIDLDEFKKELYSYITPFEEINSKLTSDDFESVLGVANDLIVSMGTAWRFYFIKYQELYTLYQEPQGIPVIDDDDREKIVETVSKALEEEIKR